jgi:hypothetical protein
MYVRGFSMKMAIDTELDWVSSVVLVLSYRKLWGRDENLFCNKKLADETLTSLSTGSNSTSRGCSGGLLLSLRNYRALVYMRAD